MATGDKENWWEEYHGFTQNFKEDGYKPDVKIEHMDEMNWKHPRRLSGTCLTIAMGRAQAR